MPIPHTLFASASLVVLSCLTVLSPQDETVVRSERESQPPRESLGLSQNPKGTLPAGTIELEHELEAIVGLNHGRGGGVLRVGQAPRVIWEGAAGTVIRGGAPIPTDATFEIASTSKAFTAAAVLLAMEQGLVDLDLPISTYLSPSITKGLLVIKGYDYGPDLTLRQLLGHTSGLPDYWYDPPFVTPGVNAFLHDYIADPDRFWTPQQIIPYVPGLTPIFVPGTGWHYSDSGYVLAGLILEKVTGKPLQEVYSTLIYAPLGLQDTWLHWRDTPPGGRTESHRYEGDGDMYTKRHNSADWAGGGLVSSTRDLDLFLKGLADDQLFNKPATKAAMMTWTATGTPGVQYGLGLYRVQLGGGLGWIWGHDGYGNSWMYYWPRHTVTFTGTLNQSENDWWPLVKAAAKKIGP